jgi:hypothetical protein
VLHQLKAHFIRITIKKSSPKFQVVLKSIDSGGDRGGKDPSRGKVLNVPSSVADPVDVD